MAAEIFKLTGVKIFIFAVLITASGMPCHVFANELTFRFSPSVAVPSTRERGYGNANTAYSNDIFILFNNPASLAILQDGSVFGFGLDFPVSANSSKALLENAFKKNPISGEQLNDYAAKNFAISPPYAALQGPLMFGITGKSAAFGIFNRSFISSGVNYFKNINTQSSNDIVLYRVNLHNDIICAAGAALNLVNKPLNKLDVGGSIEMFFRYTSILSEKQISLPTDPKRLMRDSGSTGERLLIGIGFNFGLLYRGFDRFSFGVAAQNAPAGAITLYSKDDKEESGFLFFPAINTGISYTVINNYFITLNVMADFKDILSLTTLISKTPRSAALNFNVGVEIAILHDFYIRFGASDMLPCGGLGYMRDNLKLNLAIYGTEYGMYSGIQNSYTLSLSIQYNKK